MSETVSAEERAYKCCHETHLHTDPTAYSAACRTCVNLGQEIHEAERAAVERRNEEIRVSGFHWPDRHWMTCACYGDPSGQREAFTPCSTHGHIIGEAERAAVEKVKCNHGWRGAGEPEVIRDRCPSCGGQVFIGKGGRLTCSHLECNRPDTWGAWQQRVDDRQRAAVEKRDREWTAPIDKLGRVWTPEMLATYFAERAELERGEVRAAKAEGFREAADMAESGVLEIGVSAREAEGVVRRTRDAIAAAIRALPIKELDE